MLADDDLGLAVNARVVRLVVLLAVDEHDEVRVLLDRPGIAQVAELRALIGAAWLLDAARELGERDDRDLHLLRHRLERARDLAHFLDAVLGAPDSLDRSEERRVGKE